MRALQEALSDYGFDQLAGVFGALISKSTRNELPPARGPEFAVQVFDMVVDRMRRSIRRFGDRSDRVAGNKEFKNRLFALGKPGDCAGIVRGHYFGRFVDHCC